MERKSLKNSKHCPELSEEDEAKLFENSAVEAAAKGRYQCRYCGMLFETLEAHDKHYRETHVQTSVHPEIEVPA
jgi:hypothetical protein